MRFIILAQYFPPETGGPQVRLGAMAKALVHEGHDVEIVTALPNYPTGRIFPEYRGRWYVREEWEGIPVHRVWMHASTGAGVNRLANYFSFAATAFFGLLRARRPDYLFVSSPPLFVALPALLYSALRRVPFIFNVADLWPDSVRELGLMKDGAVLRLAERLEKFTYARAERVSAVTEGIRTAFLERKGIPSEKIMFLPNGVDVDTFRPLTYDRPLAESLGMHDRRVVLYAGTHGYAHGMEVALKSAALLVGTGIHFLFAGAGSEKQRLMALAREMNLDNVTFLDPAPPEYIARLYSISDVGLSTLWNSPLFEGTRPAKIFASMACAKPVLYSGAGEGAYLVQESKAGVVTPPEDAAALASAVKQMLANPEESAQMGQNGRAFVEAHFSWDALVADWLDQLRAPAAPATPENAVLEHSIES